MMRRTLAVLVLGACVTLGACSKKPEDAPAKPTAAPPTAEEAAAPPPDKAVGASRSLSCGNGQKAEITCAVGEKPVCDCDAQPNARCDVTPTQ